MNNTTIHDYEIMAPVGSRESLQAAIQAGADSIYFGVEQLNMRSHSANHFTIDDLREIAATCTEHGMKSYLTVNTIIYDEDVELMHQIVDAAKEANISAVIASDVAVMTYCREIGVEVHLSTQLNISNAEALKFYAQFADVVVLARELNMDQVAYIFEQIERQHICGPKGELIRIEMFCHGALCMAVSGKCYMSLMNTDTHTESGRIRESGSREMLSSRLPSHFSRCGMHQSARCRARWMYRNICCTMIMRQNRVDLSSHMQTALSITSRWERMSISAWQTRHSVIAGLSLLTLSLPMR